MKKITTKKPKSVATKKVEKLKPVTEKLSKQDPEYYKKIGEISAKKRKLNSTYFSDMAKKSHLPGSRDGYHGGRKPKTDKPES
jgi:hypothetical protein